jgi:FdhD protein
MRTPGDEIAHTVGFCLAEGIIESFADIATIGFCEQDETNVATVTLTEARRQAAAPLLERKGFVSQSSCGICGKEVIKDLRQIVSPLPINTRFSLNKILACVESLPAYQHLHRKTRAAHAAVLFDSNMNMLSHAEDVGRHNALDKAIGKVFMKASANSAVFVLMSSRLSYELVQKAARAGIELMVGISRPTALGVELAESVNMTLCWARGGGLTVFCSGERIVTPS